MAVIAREKQFELPEDGQYLAVLADVVDLGVVVGAFGPKHRVQLVFVLDALTSEGSNFIISIFANNSLHEKATLRKTLKAIMRRDLTREELAFLDMDTLIGTTVSVITEQSESDGKTYSNIVAILPAKGQKMDVPSDFQRQVDKDGTGTTDNPAVKKEFKRTTGKAGFAQKSQPVREKQTISADEVGTIDDQDIPF